MPLSLVDPTSTEIEHLASVDVHFSGTHIGGGLYIGANHFPALGGVWDAIPQRGLTGEAPANPTTEIDFTLPIGGAPWLSYRSDTNGDGNVTTADTVLPGFDAVLHVGASIGAPGTFYDGPAAPMLIANDPTDLVGNITMVGYPNSGFSLTGTDGVMHELTGGSLDPSFGTFGTNTVGTDTGGFFAIKDALAVGGMSGSGTYLDFDADGDGTNETYLIGSVARAGVVTLPDGSNVDLTLSAALSSHYDKLASAIEGLSGAAARTADDFPIMALLSGQTLGSANTTVQGEFFHENLFGGINDDTLLGAGGNDNLFGRAGADTLDGGTGDDTLDGGEGDDIMTGGAGIDFFQGASLGGGSTDTITDFATNEVVDLSSHFATYDDVLLVANEPGDGHVYIPLPAASGGGTLVLQNTTMAVLTNINFALACFDIDTQIETPRGLRNIAELTPGDLVHTHTGTLAKLLAVRKRQIGPIELHNNPQNRPIRLGVGALGPGCPSRPLIVSPQHRLLANGPIADRMEQGPTLVPAKALLALDGVEQLAATDGVTYCHLLFTRHEVIQANGCWTESLLPGAVAIGTFPLSEQAKIRSICSDIPAYPLMSVRRTRNLVARHIRNNKPIQHATAQAVRSPATSTGY